MAAIFDESKDVKCNIRERVFQSEISSSFFSLDSFLMQSTVSHSLVHSQNQTMASTSKCVRLCTIHFVPLAAAIACTAIQCAQLNSMGKVTKLTR